MDVWVLADDDIWVQTDEPIWIPEFIDGVLVFVCPDNAYNLSADVVPFQFIEQNLKYNHEANPVKFNFVCQDISEWFEV